MNRQMWHGEVFYRDVAGRRWVSFHALEAGNGKEALLAVWLPDEVVRRGIEMPPPPGKPLSLEGKRNQFDGPDMTYEVGPDLISDFLATMREALTLAKQHPVRRDGYLCLIRRSIADPLEVAYDDKTAKRKLHAIIP